jgi:hypothetical protein
MLRLELRLLPQGENEKENKIIASSNALAERGFAHLKKLIGKKRCRKHPSSPNKIRVYAVKGGDPKAEVVVYCCPHFLKALG